MFDTLVASKATRSTARGGASLALVTLLHTAIIAGAMWATGRDSAAEIRPTFFPIDDWPGTPAAPVQREPLGPLSPLNPPVVSPPALPLPPDLTFGPVPGPPFAPLAPVPAGRPGGSDGESTVLPVAVVEELPELLSAPVPAYPEALRRLGVAGRVTVDVVVDTLGRVEPRSFTLVDAPHPGLVEPVRHALARALFRPARVHGRAVRVLVRIPFEFRIEM